MLAGLSAQAGAGTGGVGPGGGGDGGGDDSGGGGGCTAAKFGDRTLERGDCGGDVTTLNWLLKSDDYVVPLDRRFGPDTHGAVRSLQKRKGLKADGVVDGPTRRKMISDMGSQKASWYGPGFYGNRTACGQTLTKKMRGVAHRSLPCGTKVVFAYGGRVVRTRVIDRGPFVKQRRYDRDWDLTAALARKLRFDGVDTVRTAPIR